VEFSDPGGFLHPRNGADRVSGGDHWLGQVGDPRPVDHVGGLPVGHPAHVGEQPDSHQVATEGVTQHPVCLNAVKAYQVGGAQIGVRQHLALEISAPEVGSHLGVVRPVAGPHQHPGRNPGSVLPYRHYLGGFEELVAGEEPMRDVARVYVPAPAGGGDRRCVEVLQQCNVGFALICTASHRSSTPYDPPVLW